MPVEFLPSSRAKRDHQRVATSSKRPEDSLERPSAILNPAVDPDSTTYNSIASAFDFQHHLGSDPSAELRVVKCILLRECLISHLEAVCCDVRKRDPRRVAMPNQGPDKPLGENAEEIIQLLSRTRDTTVAVIEAIVVWRGENNQHPPSPFLWHGENYLIKITNDMNFLAGVEPLSTTLKIHPARLCRNPLMLPKTLDEQQQDGELVETSDDSPSPRVGKRRRLYNAAQILLDEESLQRERELVREKPEQHSNHGKPSPLLLDERRDIFQVTEEKKTKGVVKLPTRIKGASSSSSVAKHVFLRRSVEDKDGVQRILKLSSWHKKARSQLISLSRSPADDQYLLHSSRFWNRKELVYGDPRHQSSPSRRQSPGPGRSKRYALSKSISERDIDSVIPRGKGLQEVQLVRSDRIPRNMGHPRHVLHVVGSHEDAARIREVDGGCKVTVDSNQTGGDDASQEGKVKSSSLAGLTVQDIQSLLEEETPIPAAAVVCAAVAFLLSSDEKFPEGFHWPQGFEAVALPVNEFLDKLHDASRGEVSPFKARALKSIMQREDMLPMVIERQGQHSIACLCAWVLENLQACEEFHEWSHFALNTWYETQQPTNRVRAPKVPQDSTGVEPRATLFYKALHRLSGVGSSFVISLFKDSDRYGGLFVRAFDRASSETFWLPLSVRQVASFGSNANRSPTRLASALARTLTMKRRGENGARRLVIPPIKFRKNGVVCNVVKNGRVKVSSGNTNTRVVGLPGVKPRAMQSIRVSDILQQTRSAGKVHRPLHFLSGRSKMDGDSPKGSSRHRKIAKDSPMTSVSDSPMTSVSDSLMTSFSVGKENVSSLPSVNPRMKEARNGRHKEQGASSSLCKAKRDGQGKPISVSARGLPKPGFGQGGVNWESGCQAPRGVRIKKIPTKYHNRRAVRREGRVQGGVKGKAVIDASLLSDSDGYEDDFEDGDGGM